MHCEIEKIELLNPMPQLLLEVAYGHYYISRR